MKLARHLPATLALAALVLTACANERQTATANSAAAARGATLFRDKGCATCHQNGRIAGTTGVIPMGPDLSSYAGDPEYLRRWLRDPKAVRPDAKMPRLDLTDAEITALIAFLNAKNATE